MVAVVVIATKLRYHRRLQSRQHLHYLIGVLIWDNMGLLDSAKPCYEGKCICFAPIKSLSDRQRHPYEFIAGLSKHHNSDQEDTVLNVLNDAVKIVMGDLIGDLVLILALYNAAAVDNNE